MEGLNWLITLYKQNLNGIMADEMGLGKTIQIISLFAHLAEYENNWGPHLIVVPSSLIINWEIELRRWLPSFKLIVYYGNDRKEKRKGWSKFNSFHICITSYHLILNDIPIFKRRTWEYLILDEAQYIKNFKSKKFSTLLQIRTNYKILLTGTPL